MIIERKKPCVFWATTPNYGEAPVQLKRVPRKLAGVERAGLLVSLALSTGTYYLSFVEVTFPVNGSKDLGNIATQ